MIPALVDVSDAPCWIPIEVRASGGSSYSAGEYLAVGTSFLWAHRRGLAARLLAVVAVALVLRPLRAPRRPAPTSAPLLGAAACVVLAVALATTEARRRGRQPSAPAGSSPSLYEVADRCGGT
ncbi:hypothetical protein ACE2AJ_08030 [Aquihabitans daechungensis]|uniref:hypothetical protein n=1 Tax=Aquihabitans daechungensis TaxID=1052257 RepID=UPI003BA098C2